MMSGQSDAATEDLSRAAVILLRHYFPLPAQELARRIKSQACGNAPDNRLARKASGLSSAEILRIIRDHDTRMKRLAA